MSFTRQSWRRAVPPVATRERMAVGLAWHRQRIDIVVGNGAATIQAAASLPNQARAHIATVIPHVTQTIRVLLAEQNIASASLCGIGMGVPMLHATAALSSRARVVADDATLVAALQEAFGIPVYRDTPTNLATLGEQRYGAGRATGDMLYVALGATITAGITMNGTLHRGGAGAIGHMALDPHGDQCHCGQRGCLETSAGAAAIIARAQSQGSAVTTLAQVIAAAHQGDVGSRAALAHAGAALGTAIANVVVLLHPALIVLGGATTQAGDLLITPIRQAIMRHPRLARAVPSTVVLGALGCNAVALGGMAAALDHDNVCSESQDNAGEHDRG